MKKLLTLLLFLGLTVSSWGAARTLMSVADGNWSAAGTWAVCDATAESDSDAANTTLTMSVLYSSTFIPGAITVDGIAVKVGYRKAAPAGTVTVCLTNVTDGALVESTSVNVADIPDTLLTLNYVHGWAFFKFVTTPTLIAGKSYAVGAYVSSGVGAQVYLMAASGNNWSRQLRTTTTSAPAAGDKLIICGEHTGAGAVTSRSIILDNTATTVLGATTYPQSISVQDSASLICTNTAATPFRIDWAGLLFIGEGGKIDTSALASDSTMLFNMSVAVNVDSGIYVGNGGTLKLQGAPKQPWTYLSGDMIVGQTNFTVLNATGWAVGDILCFASTSRTYSECEARTNALAGGSSTNWNLTWGFGTAYAHSGTAPFRAEVGNLTRNVKVGGTSAALQGYIYCAATSTNDWDNAELYWLGSATTGKRGLNITSSAADRFNANSCALRDWIVATSGSWIEANAFGTLLSNVTYNLATDHIALSSTTDGAQVIGSHLGMLNTASTGYGINIAENGPIVTNSTFVGMRSANAIFNIAATFTGTFRDNVAHSGAGYGFQFMSVIGGDYRNNYAWRNTGGGIYVSGGSAILSDSTVTDNLIYNIIGLNAVLSVTNCTLNSSATLSSTAYGLSVAGCRTTLMNSSLGITTGHGTVDILSNHKSQTILRNTVLGSSSETSFGSSDSTSEAFIGSQRHDGTNGFNMWWTPYGSGYTDTATYHTRGPSLRVVPSSASNKLTVPDGYGWRVAVPSNTVRTASVWVRMSTNSVDSASYNGAMPRLIAYMNVATGLTTNAVLATAAGPHGTWEKLTGTLPTPTGNVAYRLFVDCDGTTGWVNADDFSGQADGTLEFDYARDGFPALYGTSGGNVSSGTVQ